MKKKHLSILVITVFLAVLTLWGCKGKETGSSHSFDKDASYALGMAYGTEIKNNIDMSGIVPDYDQLVKGFKDSLTGNKMRFDLNEAMGILEEAFIAMTEARNIELEQEENAFLAENAKKPGIIITSSGLQYEVLKEGSGAKPGFEDTVLVNYTGTLVDGTVFDNSQEPTEIPLSRVVSGWAEGLQLMSIGSSYILYIPSEIGYGPEGLVNPMTGMQIIPQYATLIFEVELVGINKE
ncbi:MAG: FKBP-type peptidyl-prolyl cis-trans isomerase [Treponema sp.]|jgi:FKBP-type peptidyl-prolyl cis-trans isomerase|nr:FKBP-type peptidyl-prolyl cis-trans isomerase [Treponema sp.]